MNQILILEMQSVREVGGFDRKVELGVISITVKVNVKFAKDVAEGKEVNDEE